MNDKKPSATTASVQSEKQAVAQKQSALSDVPAQSAQKKTVKAESLKKAPPQPQRPLAELAMKILLFRRKEITLQPDLLTEMAKEIEQAAQEELAVEPGHLLGILALCALPGRDVHFLNIELKIDEHIDEETVLPGRLQEARDIIKRRSDSLCAIFVYENAYQYLHKNGELHDDDSMA